MKSKKGDSVETARLETIQELREALSSSEQKIISLQEEIVKLHKELELCKKK